MDLLLGVAFAWAVLAAGVHATPQNVPPRIAGDVQVFGHTSDPNFVTGNASNPNDPGYYSDGGAGGFVNGYHMLTLSDARILNVFGKVHTGYAFTDPKNPLNITIIGNYTTTPHSIFQGNGNGQGTVRSDDTDACNQNTNPNFAPAPNTMMVCLDIGTTGINVWSVYCGDVVYNTLIEWEVDDLEGLVASSQDIPNKRTVDRLFNASQPLYGTDGIAVDDDFIYFVALNGPGYKLARVAKDRRTDITQYRYWYPTAGAWNETIPNVNNTEANFLNGTNPGNGVQFGSDLFFSPYFNTWLFSYSSFGYAGIYNLAYSNTGRVEGPYTDLGPLYTPPLDSGCDPNDPCFVPAAQAAIDYGADVVYLTHSHPGYDPNGKTLTMGWISCDTLSILERLHFNSEKRIGRRQGIKGQAIQSPSLGKGAIVRDCLSPMS